MRIRHVHVAILVVFLGLSGCSGALPTLPPPSPEAKAVVADRPATVARTDPEIAGRERVATDPVPYTIAMLNPSRAGQMLTARGPVTAPAPRTRSLTLPRAADATPNTKENLFDVVTVLWGTDRKVDTQVIGPSPIPAPNPVSHTPLVTSSIEAIAPIVYAKPTTERGNKLVTGAAVVTIPRTARAVGTIPRPRQYTFLNVHYYRETESPAKHFTIASLRVLDALELSRRANSELDRAIHAKDQALVFVHGYNTSFDDALYRAAQIAHDLEFDGLTAMYSWPSRGTYVDYSYDLNSAARSQRYLIEFLGRLAKETRVKQIHIVAHSMGNRPLIEALRTVQTGSDRALQSKLGQIVFAAPDVDRDLFSEITAQLKVGAGRTLYASNEDKALILSRQADGIPRAGDVPADGPVILSNLDTIDISKASTNPLLSTNHSDYAERSHILKDIRLLIETGTRPPDIRFPLYAVAEARTGKYWRYTPNN
ncbi:MAG: alpha/beta hydrolase [Hyphomicrobiaceae bacterium]